MSLLLKGLLAAICGLTLSLGGCSSTSDITDSLQEKVADFNPFGTQKKPLPGTRRAVFPEGVPGVQQGVPSDLMVGAQPEPEVVAEPQPTATRRAAEPARPSRRQARSSPPATREARRPPRTRSADPPDDAVWPDPAPPPAPTARTPAPTQPAPQAARTAPAAPSAPSAWPTPGTEPVPTVWPDPPKTGSFSR